MNGGTCKYCGVTLGPSKKPRVTSACRACKHKHYRDKDPEKFRQQRISYYHANKDRFRELHEKYRRENLWRWREKSNRNNRTLRGQYRHAKYKAKRFRQGFDISLEQYAALRSMPCTYCGCRLNETGSGLDRKDCSFGYTIENVVPCCGPCNRIKRELLTYDEMKAAMTAVMTLRRAKEGHGGLVGSNLK